ncbi:DUF485 domain-containing protein [Calycomorphotria hydatis]|uniref:Inner membrane protein YjcH n=1 Tax=Calycomorphotria hydatis TaxID=2528027 RepID=A0A517TA80_9PLAN|nr:DUF485 domain-containing protein [Calycomorphotria hydatis]QDT65280.1 hypothetical protein V22_25280 [Calycomorphotria hydatis]
MRERNQRIGLSLFFCYLFLYGGFVFLAAFFPEVMDRMAFKGLNVAIVYGFVLIIAALIAALIYGFACKPEEDTQPAGNTDTSTSTDEGGAE